MSLSLRSSPSLLLLTTLCLSLCLTSGAGIRSLSSSLRTSLDEIRRNLPYRPSLGRPQTQSPEDNCDKTHPCGVSISPIPRVGDNSALLESTVINTYTDEWMGYTVAYLGDVNGDGLGDVAIGSPGSTLDPFTQAWVGVVFVVFGTETGIPHINDPSELDGNNGFAIRGQFMDERVGESVKGAGDVNGDGIPDIIIGAPGSDSGTGKAYIIFGKMDTVRRRYRFDPTIILSDDLNEDTGVVFRGNYTDDGFGTTVSDAGDINGDGIADVVIGAPKVDEVYVIFGSQNLASIDVSDLDGDNGFVILTTEEGRLGEVVASAGDFNGDGVDDLMIGAPAALSDAGMVYVLFGKRDSFDALVDPNSLDGANGFKVRGVYSFDLCGSSLVGNADLNGDGKADIVLCAPRANPPVIGGSGSKYIGGECYFFYGKENSAAFVTAYQADAVIAGDRFDKLGVAASHAGDINGDGFDDVAIIATRGPPSDGTAKLYVVYGSESGLVNLMDANDLQDSGLGMDLLVEGTNSYRLSVAPAGDVNQDGFDDLIVGIPNVLVNGSKREGQVKFLLGSYQFN